LILDSDPVRRSAALWVLRDLAHLIEQFEDPCELTRAIARAGPFHRRVEQPPSDALPGWRLCAMRSDDRPDYVLLVALRQEIH
jgi:hypothetical protein